MKFTYIIKVKLAGKLHLKIRKRWIVLSLAVLVLALVLLNENNQETVFDFFNYYVKVVMQI